MTGIEAEFEFDEDVAASLSRIDEEWPTHRRAVLNALGEDLVGNVKREIPVSSGTAKSTVRTEATGSGNRRKVIAGGMKGVDYIDELLEGTPPHAPGDPNPEENQSLARWARRNNYPGGFDAIYWSIYHYGTQPHDFISEPIAETSNDAGNIAEAVLRRRGVFE